LEKKHRILGIIPARKGSKRLPNKNILSFAGKPLSRHIIETALQSKLINKIVVSTDSDEVLGVAEGFHEVIRIKRLDELASDTSPAIDYVHHTLEVLKKEQGFEFDIVVILQPTSPLTLSDDIDKTIQKLIDTKADTAVSVMEVGHMINPLKLKVMQADKLLPYLEDEKGRMAAHEIPKVYVRNCSVYATTIDTINKNQIIGEDCRGFVMPPERSVDINDLLDFEFAEFLYNKYHK
jgi:CMP-N,N'-diacetyllegionaminic acid synthase